MEISLTNTKYGSYVQQLGATGYYKAGTGLGGKWFDDLEEAYQATLKWHLHMIGTYKRECHGVRYEKDAVKFLQEAH